jgi:hypothetical protein
MTIKNSNQSLNLNAVPQKSKQVIVSKMKGPMC